MSEYERNETHTHSHERVGLLSVTNKHKRGKGCVSGVSSLHASFAALQCEPDVMYTILDKIPGKMKELKNVRCLIKQAKIKM